MAASVGLGPALLLSLFCSGSGPAAGAPKAALGESKEPSNLPSSPNFHSPPEPQADGGPGARPPPGLSTSPPNVVLFFIDTLRAAQVHCYGYPRATTPSLDSLAARGTLFEAAIAPSSWSLPTYSSLFTSLPPPAHAVDERCQKLDDSFTTLPEIFGRLGYRTAGFVGGGHLSRLFGMAQGFQTYRDAPHYGSLFHTVPAAIQWLRDRDPGPFFLMVQGYDAHLPYKPPMGFAEMYDRGYAGPVHDLNVLDSEVLRTVAGNVFRWVGPSSPAGRVTSGAARSVREVRLGAADVAHVVAHYDGAVTYADTWLGLFLESMARLGLDDRTVIVVAGDHGEELGEHGYFGHRWSLYDRQIHVPLVIAGPGVARGRRVTDVVETFGLAPTLLALAGFPPDHGHVGRSLAPYLAPGGLPPAEPDRVAFSALSDQLSARSRRWHLILRPSGARELYDLAADPLEQTDVSAREPGQADRLAGLLRDWQERHRAEPRGTSPHLTDAERAAFRQRGYW